MDAGLLRAYSMIYVYLSIIFFVASTSLIKIAVTECGKHDRDWFICSSVHSFCPWHTRVGRLIGGQTGLERLGTGR